MRCGAEWARILALSLLVLPPPVWGQDDPADDDGNEDDEAESLIEMGGDAADVAYDGVRIDPFPPIVPPELEEPNRPEPVTVGVWEPPALKEAERKELDELLARRAAAPDDFALRLHIADFYRNAKWLPHAEAEYLECARIDPKSIRPWEGLLEVYATDAPDPEVDFEEILIGLGGAVPARRIIRRGGDFGERADWIPSPRERQARVTRALRRLVELRPDDVERRRELKGHLGAQGRYDLVATEARAILELVPDDAATRYDLAQCLLYLAQSHRAAGREAEAAEAMKEMRALLEENVRRAPDHAPSSIRLARLYAVEDGAEKAERIEELENRAFLQLYVVPALGKAAFREDVFRMARNLAGPGMANDIWNGAMDTRNRRWDDETTHLQRWLELRFPHAQPRDRESVIPTLARRGDEAAAIVLLSFLWHLEDSQLYDVEDGARARDAQRLEAAALAAVARFGGMAFPVAERFLKHADTPVLRRRGVAALRGIGDKRAVGVLLDALAWDVDEHVALGVTAALEELGDDRAVDALVAASSPDGSRPANRCRDAAEALAAFRDPRSIEALNRLAKDPAYATVSAYGLYRLTGDEKALASLLQFADSGDNAAELLRLCAKCDRPGIRDVFFRILRASTDPLVRESTLRAVQSRYGDAARDEINQILLRDAESSNVAAFVIRELGEMGTEEAVDRLLKLVANEKLPEDLWTVACRALARTGDARAVRYFSRQSILEKDPGKRKLATLLYAESAKRQAQLNR